ncbi:hypothetical protein WJX81_007405 [Elliptochloris bilobata]|uniref:Uncharacterized protein n=1 Tax=Elliptochloris bilobata TaxID=381761 RepID=A0AAW1RUL8_9CHLO
MGYAIAQQFLAACDSVVLCARCERKLEGAIASLREEFPYAKVAGVSGWGAKFIPTAATHKTSKTGLTALTASLAQELRAAGLTSIGVHNLSPGLVLTGLLLDGASPAARRFFNALAEEPETDAAELVPRMRVVQGMEQTIAYLSPASAFAWHHIYD